jgi:hypothetical protein
MLLDDLLKPSIIQLRELGQIMNIRNNTTQVLLQYLKLILDVFLLLLTHACTLLATGLKPGHQRIDLFLFISNLADEFCRSDLLEGEDFVELEFELGNEGLFIVFGPFSPGRARVLWGGLGHVGCFEGIFEIVVVDVVVVIVAD